MDTETTSNESLATAFTDAQEGTMANPKPKKVPAKPKAKPAVKAKPAKKAVKAKPAKKAVKAKPAKKTAKKNAKAVKKTGPKKGAKRKAIQRTATGKPINSWSKRKADPRKETLLQEAFRALKRKAGATRAELLEILGWKAVSVQQITGNAAKVINKDERPFRYKLAA